MLKAHLFSPKKKCTDKNYKVLIGDVGVLRIHWIFKTKRACFKMLTKYVFPNYSILNKKRNYTFLYWYFLVFCSIKRLHVITHLLIFLFSTTFRQFGICKSLQTREVTMSIKTKLCSVINTRVTMANISIQNVIFKMPSPIKSLSLLVKSTVSEKETMKRWQN